MEHAPRKELSRLSRLLDALQHCRRRSPSAAGRAIVNAGAQTRISSQASAAERALHGGILHQRRASSRRNCLVAGAVCPNLTRTRNLEVTDRDFKLRRRGVTEQAARSGSGRPRGPAVRIPPCLRTAPRPRAYRRRSSAAAPRAATARAPRRRARRRSDRTPTRGTDI